jgi:response regulator RpfG family c-di-GMP phosphodiesterase
MPVMDGYSAARAIRDLERGTGKHVPIIALTAHAMAGERERVRRAGMDDYLSKPARPRLLLKLLNHFLHEQSDDPASEPAMKAENGASELDPNTRRSEALIRLCLKLIPGQMEAVRAAVAKADCPEVRAAAHKLKGGALSMAAGPMSRLAERLQHNAESGDLSSAPQLLHDLEVSYKRVERQLRRELKALLPQDKPEESQLA